MITMPTPLVSSEWLNDNINDPDILILDASEKDNKAGLMVEFDDVQISGARKFDLKNEFSDRESNFPNTLPSPEDFERAARKLGINNSSKIVVYDNLGIYNSPRVWWMFKTMGHQQIAVLDGGLPDWIEQEFEVEPIQDAVYETGDFKANYNAELYTDIKTMVHNLSAKNAYVIDARSEGRFNGTAAEPRKGLSSGHIPGSVNLPYGNLLDNGKFKSKAALAAIFKQLNFGDQSLVFSCGSGITASILFLAAELCLDNQKSVFDGSWTEWALSDLPIEKKQ